MPCTTSRACDWVQKSPGAGSSSCRWSTLVVWLARRRAVDAGTQRVGGTALGRSRVKDVARTEAGESGPERAPEASASGTLSRHLLTGATAVTRLVLSP